MSDVAPANRPNLGRFKRGNGCRVAIKRDELDFVGLGILVNMNHGAYISGFEPFSGYRCH